MKKILITVITSLILLPILLSCGNSVDDPCECSDKNLGYIDVYYEGGSKTLDGSWKMRTITVPSRMVVDDTFRQIETEFEEMTIYGMEFRNIISIEGLFTQEEVVPPLKHLKFDSKLESIGTKCFRWSRKLENVIFDESEIIPEIWIDAFPDAGTYESEHGCAFKVPVAFKEEYREQLRNFIDDENGYLLLAVKIKLDTNNDFYSSDPAFGTPSLSSDTLDISTGDVLTEIPVPTMEGWTFTGYYENEDNDEKQLFTTAGDLIPSVPVYSNSLGAWICENELTTVFAHWEKNKYTVTIEVNDETSGEVSETLVEDVDFGAVLSVSDNTLTIKKDDGDVIVTATPTDNTTKTSYEFTEWKDVTEKVTDNMTITAVFSSYTNPGFDPSVKADTLVDFDMGTDELGSRHTYVGLSVPYHSTKLSVSLKPYGAYTSVEGFYADSEFGTKVAGEDGTFVLNVSGYTDDEGWACSDAKATLYVKWN